VKLKLAWVGRTKDPAIKALTAEYGKRISHYIQVETQAFDSEEGLLKWVEKISPRPYFVILDSHGKQLSSEELAKFIGDHQDRGTQVMLFAIGPANGFSEPALDSSQFRLSLGRMTLPHELALAVMMEQIYRSYTIIKGHPYHIGH
jgi:23S rRNA (pseudouridine1915-N3)-methyltransferase